MSGLETIFIIFSNISVLAIFFITGIYYLAPEYQFQFYKLFALCSFLYLCAEFFKLRVYSKFRRELMMYMQQNLNDPNSEIQEVHFAHHLFNFYQQLITLLNKLIPDQELLKQDQFSLKPYLKLSKNFELSKHQYMEEEVLVLVKSVRIQDFFSNPRSFEKTLL
ncbi:hypothetical protein MJH12_08435 [bacterium]|nr:hypothetical protein [bacterium]